MPEEHISPGDAGVKQIPEQHLAKRHEDHHAKQEY
jgi:hypothetical protein